MKTLFYILLCLFLRFALAAQNKGYIDYDSVVKALPQYPALQQQLALRHQQLQDSFNILGGDLEKFYTTGIPHNAKLDALKKKDLEDSISVLMERIDRFRAYAQQVMTSGQEKTQWQLHLQLKALTKAYCIEKGVIVLAGKSRVLYCEACRDYTQDLVLYLEQEK